jgi:hypothetical protein
VSRKKSRGTTPQWSGKAAERSSECPNGTGKAVNLPPDPWSVEVTVIAAEEFVSSITR